MSFAAYITSFLPTDNPELRDSRSAVTKRQILWWLNNTDIHVTVVAMNYTDEDFITDLPDDARSRLYYHINPPMKITPARVESFKLFYASDYDFGIIMDDDAILYDKPHHNSGPKLFSEMISNGISRYDGVDVFFPINPQKIGFNPIWDKDPQKYTNNHVFKRSMDLKGSMCVVRNFRKFGMKEVWHDTNFTWQEDTKFAIDCVAAGHTVLQCQNIILHELSGKASHFSADPTSRLPKMLEGNTRIAEAYASMGLKMKTDSHLLDRGEFMDRCWFKPKEFVIPKGESMFYDIFDI